MASTDRGLGLSGAGPALSIEWRRFDALSAAELYRLLQFRQAIFVVEQRSPYPDLDGLDRDALHLLLHGEDGLAGYLRLIPSPPPRIGRVAVAAPLRRRGLGRRLVEAALRRCGKDWPGGAVVLSAQSWLVPFYESFGFAVTSAPYDDFGVPHVDMARRIE